MRYEQSSNVESKAEPEEQVQSFDCMGAIERIREEKTYKDHGRSICVLTHEPSVKLALTVLEAGRSTGQRRVASASTVQVLEGEVKLRAGEERHVLSTGGTLVVQGNVAYDAEAVSDAAFLYTLVEPPENTQDSPQLGRPVQPEE